MGWIDSARAAPLRVLLAYVWPAVALEAAGQLFDVLQARLGILPSPPASAADADASAPASGLEGGVAQEGSLAGLSARSDPNSEDGRGGLSILPGAEISSFVAILFCAALMGMVAFAIGRELRSMHR